MSMKGSIVLAVAVAGLLSAACAKENVESSQSGSTISRERHQITLNVLSNSDDGQGEADNSESVADSISTKAIFATNIKDPLAIYWQKDDKIGVQATGSESLYPLGVKSRAANLQSATFSGEIEGELGGYAVYPYNEGHKISGNTLTYHLPSTYNVALDNDYVSNMSSVDAAKESANFALLAKITEDGAVFQHLCGLLCIKIDAMPSSSCTLTITADRKICGDFAVDLSSSQPEIASDDESSTDNVVTISSRGVLNNPGVYYVPMPIGEYNISVELSHTSPNKGIYASGTAVKNIGEIERAKVRRLKITQIGMWKGGYKILAGHKFIDLGLSYLWAETNVGATLPADNGNFYAWAETEPKWPYYAGNYKYIKDDGASMKTYTKYNSGDDGDELTFEIGDDAAYQNWNNECMTPPRLLFQELLNNTTYMETTRINSEGKSVKGYEFTGKNGNSIFLPYNGYYRETYTSGVGAYWINSLIPVNKGKYDGSLLNTYEYTDAKCYVLRSSGVEESTHERYFAMGVRAVAPQ